MKVWGIIATILMVVFLGGSVWLYSQNQKLNDDLSTTKSSKETAEQKLTATKSAASNKVQVLSIFFNQPNDRDQMEKAKELVKSMNDATLIADWKAMETSSPGSDTGTKMLKDLVSALEKDLK
ncbi:MAG: hypothetical protein NT135_00785 [Candidatus Berkelbacteria bacterium]|nr:hypothetical protein [Candidatus Berkelbacteria bacterium]